MPKFNLAVLLKVQSLWLNTLVFFYMHLVASCNQMQYTVYICEPRVHIFRKHYAPKLRTLDVLSIATYKMGN